MSDHSRLLDARARSPEQLAVVSQSGATVTFFDAGDWAVLSTLNVEPEPHELLFDPQRRVLYCSHTYHGGFYDNNAGPHHVVSVIDPDTHSIIDMIDLAPEHAPHGLVIDPARRLIYISVEAGPAGPGGVVVVDADTRKVLRRIDTLAPGPHWFIIDRDGATGYASNKEAPFVTVVDLVTGQVLAKIEVPGSEGISISPDSATVAVAGPKADPGKLAADPGIRLIDTHTKTIVRTLVTENALLPVHWTASGLLLAGERPAPRDGHPRVGRLLVWRGNAADAVSLIGTVDVGVSPLTISSSPDGSRAFVAASVSSTVSVIDLSDPTRPTVVDTLRVAARPGDLGAHGLAYIPVS